MGAATLPEYIMRAVQYTEQQRLGHIATAHVWARRADRTRFERRLTVTRMHVHAAAASGQELEL